MDAGSLPEVKQPKKPIPNISLLWHLFTCFIMMHL
jgi:hypothetical protein